MLRWRNATRSSALISGSGAGILTGLSLHAHACQHFFFDELPDPANVRVEFRALLDFERTRPVQVDRNNLLHAAGPGGKDDDAVRKINRLFDLMRDKEHG